MRAEVLVVGVKPGMKGEALQLGRIQGRENTGTGNRGKYSSERRDTGMSVEGRGMV